MPEDVKMSTLFVRHNTLILYSFMYGREREAPPAYVHAPHLICIGARAGNAISQSEQSGSRLLEKLYLDIIHFRSARHPIPSRHFRVCRKATGLPSESRAVTRMPNG
jgi:hypothetical protein